MPTDAAISPTLFLAMWAGGIAIGTGWVARLQIVGAGYLWVAGGTALLAGAFAAAGGGWALAATAMLVVGILLARRPSWSGTAFIGSGTLYLAQALPVAGFLFTLSGALALGAVMCEMLLGHWYLVDPTLPREPLRRLAMFGVGGVLIDMGLVLATVGSDTTFVLRWSHLGLGSMSVLLMVGVWFSLKEKGYPAVMAATGLSYLAILTSLGAVAVGRVMGG